MSAPSTGGGGPRWDEGTQRWVGEGAEPPAPGRRPPNPQGGMVLLAVLAVALVGGIGVGAWKLLAGDGDGKPQTQGGSASATSWSSYPSASPAPSSGTPSSAIPSWPSSAPPSAGAEGSGGPPPDYMRTTDPEGFTLDVPAGWQRVKRETGVFYESSDASSLIQIFAMTEPEVTPYEALRKAETGLKKNPGYKRYRLERLGSGEGADAELEYGYRSEKYGQRRIIDRAFTGPDQVQYAVLIAGPAAQWPLQRERQRIVLAAFCPAGHCPAA
ncbi:hypothetical protein ABZU86_18555 [Streptomyces sp. NPDC005271]|uniref:hypothetical protein n=1 Tax=unclassified Streptomyces TaxID=2593676 RepID=UPI0033A05F08